MAPPLIQLKDIGLTFGGTPLLDGAELSVSAGERVCLVGRNGSGKSTLLKIAAGLVEPDGGTRFIAARRDRALPAAGARFRRLRDRARLCAGRARARRRSRSRRATCWSNSDSTGEEDPGKTLRRRGAPRGAGARAGARAGHPAARRADQSSRSADHRVARAASSPAALARSSSSATTGASSTNLSRATVWLDRGRTRRIERGFAEFEAWRDEVLAEEERDQHKLDRKIVAEEHWLRYGVTARRKRNVRRLGRPAALRQPRREQRASAGNAELVAARPTNPARWSSRRAASARRSASRADRRRFLDPHSARRPRRHRRPEWHRQDHADQAADRCARARSAARCGSAPISRWRRSTSTAKASTRDDAGRRAHRRPRRHRHGRRRAAARHRLHEGLPVRARAGATPRCGRCRAASAAG